jgi:hypothetical protein
MSGLVVYVVTEEDGHCLVTEKTNREKIKANQEKMEALLNADQ